MAMNKKEQAEMQALREQLALAQALRWPDYTAPTPINTRSLKFNDLLVGWYGHEWDGGYNVGQGCTNGRYHSTHSTEKTTTQGAGVFYATRLEALRAVRLAMTQRCAKILARIDQEIVAEERKAVAETADAAKEGE